MALTKNVLTTAGLFMLGGACFLTLGPAGYLFINAFIINAVLTTFGLALYEFLSDPAVPSPTKGGRHTREVIYTNQPSIHHTQDVIYTHKLGSNKMYTNTHVPQTTSTQSHLPPNATVTKVTPVAANRQSPLLPNATITKMTPAIASTQPSLPPNATVTKVTPVATNRQSPLPLMQLSLR